MKKIWLLSLLAVASLTSCLKDDTDYFDKSATERLNEAIENATTVLQGAANGWRMELYPEATRIYGGYTVFAKFGKDQVTVSSENFSPDESDTSYYSISAESGPMLTFDTYNKILHFYADATTYQTYGIGSAQRGLNGDSDFIVMSADPTCVHLRGRKTNNEIYMYPVESADWETELAEYADIADRLQLAFESCEVDGVSYPLFYESALNSFTARKFRITYADEVITAPYSLTKTGIKFYEPLVLGSHEITEMTLVDDWYLATADGSVKIYSPEPIRSDNTFAVEVSDVDYSNATVAITPTNDADYYYWDLYEKSALAAYSDRGIISAMLSHLNDNKPSTVLKSYASLGEDEYTFTTLSPETEYVVVVIGISASRDESTIVATTGLTKYEFKTDPVPPLEPDYEKWLGEWQITSTSSVLSNKALTYDVTIAMGVPNASVKITGLSVTSKRLSYALPARYNSDGSLTVLSSTTTPIGEDATYNYFYAGYYLTSTSYTRVGGNYTALTGSLNGDNAAQFDCGTVTTSGTKRTIVGLEIFGQNKSSGSWYTFSPTSGSGYTAKDYGVGPYTLKKVSAATQALQVAPKNALVGAMMPLVGLRDFGVDNGDESFTDEDDAIPCLWSEYEDMDAE